MESRHQNQRCPKDQRGIENYIQSVDVIEGETTKDVISGVDLGRMRTDQLINVGDEVVVRKHHSLGQSGSAAGVWQRCEGLLRRLIGLGINRRHRMEQIGKWLGARSMLARGIDTTEVG